jgi:hypothetical protein
MPDRAQAQAMVEKLSDPAQVEALTKEAQKAGLTYHAEYSAETDSALFSRGMQAGEAAVWGPDSTERGWAATRVVAVLAGQPRPYSEVRELVRHAVYGEEGERLMLELLGRMRMKARVEVNDRGLDRLFAAGTGHDRSR